MEVWNGFNSLVVISDVVFFIWRMQVITVQPEAHKNNVYPEFFFHDRTNRNASASANRNRRFTKSFLHGFCGGLVTLAIKRGEICFPTMVFECLDGYTWWSN